MLYQSVCLESIAYTLPDEVVTSDEIEARLAPLYRRLRLPEGRLELMSGIGRRRLWPRGTRPSGPSAETAEKALVAAGLDRRHVGAVVHGSVCRDFLEPATACVVHQRLGLSRQCAVYDVSNACLGLLSGVLQVADMIELGRIRAGLVMGTEDSRALLESTIRQLNSDESLSRADIKPAMASLTIGSASAAILLVDRGLSRTGNRLRGGIARTNSEQCRLCQGGVAETGEPGLLMATDSETLLYEGVATARDAFPEFLDQVGWAACGATKTFCHQVGRAHRKLLLETLKLDPAGDFTTFETLGNMGSVALPITAAMGLEQGHVRSGDRVALLGIGSGINVVMLGIDWGSQ
ncbi:MAG: 3-oxoacyl-ACP synthase III [Thermoguttaceae bacterium]|jgi:3-oxoacyl-[acyl-carrier-protein] synthase-3